MNIEKPVLTWEQGDVLEAWKEKEYYDSLVKRHTIQPWMATENECLNDLSIKEFMTGVYYGYKVEQTPEEELKERLDDHEYGRSRSFSVDNIQFHAGAISGITSALNILGIKIKGINKDVEE